MSSAKKLQGEIDRVLKAVQEGQEVFEEIWLKVHEASTAAQKEKFEGELKTQIKKLQRLREQIKSWITGDLVKDKQPLMDARRRIESDMERFKVCEKETKTKAYSKDGLAAAANNDPETQAKLDAREWLDSCIENLNTQKDALEAELEIARSKKKAGKVSEREKELEHQRERLNWHIEKMELMLRLLDNDNLSYEDIKSIQEDVDYYLQSNQDADFQEDETIYDALRLDELDQDKAGLDLLKQTKKEKELEKERREKEEAEKEELKKKEDARKADADKKRKAEEEKRLKDEQRRLQVEAERRRQEEETKRRQLIAQLEQSKAAQEQARRQEEAAAAGGKKGDGKTPATGQTGQIPPTQQSLASTPAPPAKGPSAAAPSPLAGPAAAAAAAAAAAGGAGGAFQSFLSQLRDTSADPSLLDHLGDMKSSQSSQESLSQESMGGMESASRGEGGGGGSKGLDALDVMPALDDLKARAEALEAAFTNMPDPLPKPLFDDPKVFERLDDDTLFFIFYFQTGTPQQYLAARQLKKQGWRFHKKYLTWFQRHEEPIETAYDRERGTYRYFDYETGWCQRIKTDFTFEYEFLENEVHLQ